MVGILEPDWPYTLPQLEVISIGSTSINGSIPDSWFAPGAWPNMTNFYLIDNELHGEARVASAACPSITEEVLRMAFAHAGCRLAMSNILAESFIAVAAYH